VSGSRAEGFARAGLREGEAGDEWAKGELKGEEGNSSGLVKSMTSPCLGESGARIVERVEVGARENERGVTKRVSVRRKRRGEGTGVWRNGAGGQQGSASAEVPGSRVSGTMGEILRLGEADRRSDESQCLRRYERGEADSE
jgi:hypothetical protein